MLVKFGNSLSAVAIRHLVVVGTDESTSAGDSEHRYR